MPYHGRGGAGNISAIRATNERATGQSLTAQSAADAHAKVTDGSKSPNKRMAKVSAIFSNLFSKMKKVRSPYSPPLNQRTDQHGSPFTSTSNLARTIETTSGVKLPDSWR